MTVDELSRLTPAEGWTSVIIIVVLVSAYLSWLFRR